MPEALTIPSTKLHPKVVMDADANTFSISGRALPEDAIDFFEPVQKWMEEYGAMPNPETLLVFDLEYFNSSSARQILEIITELENIHSRGHKVKVIWKHHADDGLMQDRGQEIKELVDLPFDLEAYE